MFQQTRTFTRALRLGAVLALGLTATGARAQSNLRTTEVAITYGTLRSNHVTSSNFWMQGGAVELHTRLYRGMGVVANVTGLHESSASSQVAPLDMVTVAFGPRYTYVPQRGRFSVFGEALAGEAEGFHSVFALGSGTANNVGNGTTDSDSSLAVQAGGGVDVRLSCNFAVRAVQVDYLRTQLPNGSDNVQNNLRFAAGLVYRFGQVAR
jgi:Outer membrane protein beta-barrel domain